MRGALEASHNNMNVWTKRKNNYHRKIKFAQKMTLNDYVMSSLPRMDEGHMLRAL